MVVAGSALDRDCTPPARLCGGRPRVARTYVAVERKVGGGWVPHRARPAVEAPRLPPPDLPAGSVKANRRGPGSTSSLRKRARLTRGRFFVLARSRDLAEVLERTPKRSRLVYERVR